MADFKTWSTDSLVKFCEESHAETVRLNSRYSEVVRILSALTKDYATMADQFCVRPERHEAYRNARELLK